MNGIIKVSDNISGRRIVDVLNDIFNCSLPEYRPATWPEEPCEGEKWVWFPQLASDSGKPAVSQWDNYFVEESKFLCQRSLFLKDNKVCYGNDSHHNNPLDCINAKKPIPPITPGMCKCFSPNGRPCIGHSLEKAAVFAKIYGGEYTFFGVYKFVGVQYEKNHNRPEPGNNYIEIYERIGYDLKISEWV